MKVLLAGAGLVACAAALGRVPNLAEAPGLFLLLFAAAFLCYGAGAWLIVSGRAPASVGLVLAAAVAARLVLLPAAPTLSTDAYRYVWDARVARAGVSPWAYPPDAPELARLRDQAIYPRLNHPTWRTVYPPGAQAFFRAVDAARPDSVLAMKIALAAAELIALGLVFGLLRAVGAPAAQAVIYAWNPLVLVEVWGTAHLDALALPLIIGAVWAAVRGRRALTGTLLGAGALVKFYPAALLPLLLWGPGFFGGLAAFAAVVAAGYGPSLVAGAAILGSLPRYLSEEYFNPGLLRSLADVPGLAAAAAAVWIAWIAVSQREAPLVERALWLAAGLTVLSPNVFPWYALWLVPLLAAAPSLAWIAFTGTVACAYAFFLERPWAVPTWARAVEVAPLALGALWWAARRSRPAFGTERSV